MKKRLADIRVGNEFRHLTLTEFESTAEAVRELGEERALLFINYSQHQVQRANARARIVEELNSSKK